MVPGVDGFEIARRLRAAESAERLPSIPILMLTARDAWPTVSGLRAGADDYLVKPSISTSSWPASRRCCDGPQLQARRSRLARRCSMPISSSISPVAPSAAESATSTSRREFDLLILFLRHPEKVLPRSTIMARIWGDDFFGDSNVLKCSSPTCGARSRPRANRA